MSPNEDRQIVEQQLSDEIRFTTNILTIPLDGRGGIMSMNLDKMIKIGSIIAALLSAATPLIKMVEDAFKGQSGVGAIKKDNVTQALTPIAQVMVAASTGGQKDEWINIQNILPMVGDIVESGVTLAKATGLIPNKPAAPGDVAGVGTQGS